MRITKDNAYEFRSHVQVMLSNIMEMSPTESSDISKNVEKSIYNYSIQESIKRNLIRKWENPAFKQIYVNRLRSIYMNLQSSPEFRNLVRSDKISAKTLSTMTHQEFNPQRWERLIDQKTKRDASKFNTDIQASTDVYQCKRCKSRKCVYSEQQIRSADESMTVFVTCLDCGKQWKC